MAREVITANRLVDGAVVYLSRDGEWVQDFARAQIADNEEAAAALSAAGERAVQERLVVAPYLIEVQQTTEGTRPTRYRERLRASGPSVPCRGAVV